MIPRCLECDYPLDGVGDHEAVHGARILEYAKFGYRPLGVQKRDELRTEGDFLVVAQPGPLSSTVGALRLLRVFYDSSLSRLLEAGATAEDLPTWPEYVWSFPVAREFGWDVAERLLRDIPLEL